MGKAIRHSPAYAGVGVDTNAAASGLTALLGYLKNTSEFIDPTYLPEMPSGFFANVLSLSKSLSIAISTDGVGSKVVVAQMLEQYEGIGVDCVAVNVNDVLCAGAEPVALLDYISIKEPQKNVLSNLGKGMEKGAAIAGIAIVGGELSQHPDTLMGPGPGVPFDIAGTALGVIVNREPVTGKHIVPGDIIMGFPSDGIHSNGLTLARSILLNQGSAAIHRFLPECAKTVGEELLRPTKIYAPEIRALLSAGIKLKGIAHISGDGLLNLTRLGAEVGYRITNLLEIPPIFNILQKEGNIADEEMFKVFNMGIGLCAVVEAQDVDKVVNVVKSVGRTVTAIGSVIETPEKGLILEPVGLIGNNLGFERV